MKIEVIVNGELQENCYVIMDEESKEIIIIDPGSEGTKIEERVNELNGIPKCILLTHGHNDHAGEVEYIADKFNIPYYMNEKDESYLKSNESLGFSPLFANIRKPDKYLIDGEFIPFGKNNIKVLETPGHTEGGVCFLIDKYLFCGDTLFKGSVGRTDFIGGNPKKLIKSIQDKIVPLSDDIIVYSGHGPSSSIGVERMTNPYLGDLNSIF